MKICIECHQDCSRPEVGGGIVMAYALTRGPEPFAFGMQAVAPPEAIDGEAVCRPCYLAMLNEHSF